LRIADGDDSENDGADLGSSTNMIKVSDSGASSIDNCNPPAAG